MKKTLLTFLLTIPLVFIGCDKNDGDVNTDLKGKTFIYDNGESGSLLIRRTLKFENNGNVYDKREVSNLPAFTTDGCSLYYKMNGTKFTIYHGGKGWKKDVRNTIYDEGEYFSDYIIIDGDKLKKQ